MTQKQVLGAVACVAVAVAVFFFVYQQYTGQDAKGPAMTSQKKMNAGSKDKATVAPVPDTIDGVTADIEAESALDLSALDEEEAASLEEADEDSDSINNLGTSYDENSL